MLGVLPERFDGLIALGHVAAPKIIDGQRVWDASTIYLASTGRKPLPTELVVRKHEVYVVGFDNYIKIGYSARVSVRRRQLEECLPINLTIYATMPGRQTLERALHKRFAAYRLNGEWFKREGALAEWIDGGCV